MSTYENTPDADTAGARTEASAVANIAVQGVEPHPVEIGAIFTVPDGRGGVKVIDTDDFADAPRRAKASRTVTDAASFVAYVNRHRTPGTEVFAHTSSSSVVGVLDSNQGSDAPAGWEKHKLTLALEKTKAWDAWMAHDLGQNSHGWFGQQDFAEFIEDRALDVVEPDHATLIEIASTFEAKQKADFGSAIRTDSGAVQFVYTETVAAKAGQKGTLEIPKQLRLALRPYIGGPIYYLFAQFRYRISGTGLALGYAIERPENILEAAFSDIVTEIRDGRTDKATDSGKETLVHEGIGDVPIFYGRP